MGTTPAVIYCRDDESKVLIVEGKNDCHGIYQLSCRYGLQDAFVLWDAGSHEKALARFGGLLLTSGDPKQAIGLVLDCDAEENGYIRGPERRWHQFISRLRSFPYSIPDHPDPLGTVLEAVEEYPRIGIWLMPDNRSEGMFEDFLLALAPPDAITFAQTVVEEAKGKGMTNFKDVHRSKATAHTYLAWQNEPGLPIGLAIKAHVFNTEVQVSQEFGDWLTRLFT